MDGKLKHIEITAQTNLRPLELFPACLVANCTYEFFTVHECNACPNLEMLATWLRCFLHRLMSFSGCGWCSLILVDVKQNQLRVSKTPLAQEGNKQRHFECIYIILHFNVYIIVH